MSRDDCTIAFALDALVPVVVRRGRGFDLDFIEPRILTWRLIEVPVNDDRLCRLRQAVASSVGLRSRREGRADERGFDRRYDVGKHIVTLLLRGGEGQSFFHALADDRSA